VQGDPSEGMFTQANFPGASAANLTNARALYAILSGRISEVRGVARFNEATGQYNYLGQGAQRARQRQLGLWLQDSWHMGPNLTVQYGGRYDLTFPFVALNDSYTIGGLEDVYGVSGAGNLFKPGTLTGRSPEFRQLHEGDRPYPMDWNNLAPSVGMAWTPSAPSGLLRWFTGQHGDTAIRAGYSRSFTRLGLTDFAGQIVDNPGVSLNVYRQLGLGNLGPLPLLLRDTSRLGPADFQSTPSFPLHDVVTGDITIFSPDLAVPLADTWQAGVTRGFGGNMSIEARYLGARSTGNWRTNNYNELNLIENGFLDEFKLAMANLVANNAAGGARAGSFAYYGPGTGTAPLPIFLAYFAGVGRDRSGDPSLYTSTNFRSSTFLNPLARFNPHPYQAADALGGIASDAASRARALAAGLSANFFLANPDLLGGANIVENTNRTMYHSLALEFRKRSSTGLTFTGSYVLGNATESRFLSLRVPRPMFRNGGAEGDVTHAFKLNAVYSLPFGREQRFASGVNGVVDRIIGGWLVAGNARFQSGRLLDLGNVRLVGISKDELQKLFTLRFDAQNRVFVFPQEIVDETFKAFSVSATSTTGYGTLGPPTGRYIAPADDLNCIETVRGEGKCGLRSVILSGPLFKQFDLSLVKRVDLVGRVNAEFRLDALNVFNTLNFVPVTGITVTTTPATSVNLNRSAGASQNAYEVTQLVNTAASARVMQIVARVRW